MSQQPCPWFRFQPHGWRCTRMDYHPDGPCALVRSGLRGWLIDNFRALADRLEYGRSF